MGATRTAQGPITPSTLGSSLKALITQLPYYLPMCCSITPGGGRYSVRVCVCVCACVCLCTTCAHVCAQRKKERGPRGVNSLECAHSGPPKLILTDYGGILPHGSLLVKGRRGQEREK
jgi:hypothetical protein